MEPAPPHRITTYVFGHSRSLFYTRGPKRSVLIAPQQNTLNISNNYKTYVFLAGYVWRWLKEADVKGMRLFHTGKRSIHKFVEMYKYSCLCD